MVWSISSFCLSTSPYERLWQVLQNSLQPLGKLIRLDSKFRGVACEYPLGYLPEMNWVSWALLSAFFAGLTAILAKVGVVGVNSNVATALRTTVVLCFTWLMAIPALQESQLHSLTRRTWIFLTLSGLATGASWICYFRALQLGKVSQVAPVDKLSVVLALAFAALFLGEKLTAREYVGAALIAGGSLLIALK
jgi:transporter family protein